MKCFAMGMFALCLVVMSCFGPPASAADAKDDTPVLIQFYADWCKPCKEMTPTIEAIEKDGNRVIRVNIDIDKASVSRYQVTAVPTFVIATGAGQEIDRVKGTTTLDRLRAKLQRKPQQPQAPKREATQQKERPASEPATGPKAAICRIYCQESEPTNTFRTSSVGSGTLVKWGGKLVVLTARHVVKDAKAIVVAMLNGRSYRAKVLKVDAVWDCAVLELSETPEGVAPAEVACGDEAVPQTGSILEMAGYGSDNTLKSNRGKFLGYKRSQQAPNGPDDWMELSGAARPGDSGGPVFNTNGQVVGVLWGTDGKVVMCVQAGRLHVLLNLAVPQIQQRAYDPREIEQLAQRNPTPPLPGPYTIAPAPQEKAPLPDQWPPHTVAQPYSVQPSADYLLPYRAGQAAKEAEMAGQLGQVNENLRAIQQQIAAANAAKAATPPVVAPVAPPITPAVPPVTPSEDTPPDKAKTPFGRLADRQAEWLAEHGGPISSRLAANADENLGDDSAAVRFKGFTQAKVAVLVFCLAIVGVLLLGVAVIHRINNRLIPKLQEAAAKTPNTLDDKLVGILAGLHDKVNAFEARLSPLKATADAALHVATQAAVATVPGGPAIQAAAEAASAAVAPATPIKV